MAAYEIIAYRGNRNFYLKRSDYRRTVSDGEGKPPAREQADALREELAMRSLRNRYGWTHIDIQLKEQEEQSAADRAAETSSPLPHPPRAGPPHHQHRGETVNASYDDTYEDFGDTEVPDDYCPFHPNGGCRPEDHFPEESQP